jgi:hypothetical protein
VRCYPRRREHPASGSDRPDPKTARLSAWQWSDGNMRETLILIFAVLLALGLLVPVLEALPS